jgi:hypothetical protein
MERIIAGRFESQLAARNQLKRGRTSATGHAIGMVSFLREG